MINSFSFKNYKAFQTGEIELKPITILLGANSVGKSSILQLLLMVKQTINTEKQYKSALKLNGEFISLGENKNIFHNQKVDDSLEIAFNIKEFEIKHIKRDLENQIEETFIIFEKIFLILTKPQEKSLMEYTRSSRKEIDYITLLKRIQSLKTKINNKIKTIKDISFIESLFDRFIGHTRYRRDILNFYSKKEKKVSIDLKLYKKTYELLNEFPQDRLNESFVISYRIIAEKGELLINRIEIRTNEKIVLGYEKKSVRGGKNHSLYSDLIQKTNYFDGYEQNFGNNIFFEKLNIYSKEKKNRAK